MYYFYKLLIAHLIFCLSFSVYADMCANAMSTKEGEDLGNKPIEILFNGNPDVSAGIIDSLHQKQIYTINDLTSKTNIDLYGLRLGIFIVESIEDALKYHNLALKEVDEGTQPIENLFDGTPDTAAPDVAAKVVDSLHQKQIYTINDLTSKTDIDLYDLQLDTFVVEIIKKTLRYQELALKGESL